MQNDRAMRRGRAILPNRVDWIGLCGDARGAGRRARFGKTLGPLQGVQPRVVTERRARGEVRFQPGIRRCVGDVDDTEMRGIHLFAGLQGVTSVHKNRGPIGQHDRPAR